MATTNAVSTTTSTDKTSGFGLTTGADKALNRDDFLKLLVAQMKNQDPLKPQDNTQFVAELAQFSNLEQSMGMNDRLDTLALQSRGQSNAQVLSLVGQKATVKGSIITIDGSGVGAPVNFTLANKTTSTIVNIQDQSGDVIRSIDVGPHAAGLTQIMWDGRNAAGNVQPKGSYMISVAAKDKDGTNVSVDQNTSAIVTGVAYDTGYPVLQLANGAKAPVSDLLRVDSPPISP
ncbi:MAG TPA: flagellar hook capping FlgD N-terminal domain-containing protein [Polyangiaceae bacterium]